MHTKPRFLGDDVLHEVARGVRSTAKEVEKYEALHNDQEHKLVARRLIQDATQMVTASCDAGNMSSYCRRGFQQKGGLMSATRKIAQDVRTWQSSIFGEVVHTWSALQVIKSPIVFPIKEGMCE